MYASLVWRLDFDGDWSDIRGYWTSCLWVSCNLISNRPEQWDILKDLHSLMCAGLARCHLMTVMATRPIVITCQHSTGNIWARPRSESRDAETRTCQCSVPTQSDTPMLLICCTTVGNFRLLRRNIIPALVTACSTCRRNQLNSSCSKTEARSRVNPWPVCPGTGLMLCTSFSWL